MGETFDLKKYVVKLNGKDYLETRGRVAWFRQDHPHGAIVTEVLNFDPVLVKATITDADGQVLAVDHAGAKDSGTAVWKGRAVEKACTAAIGRALALAGYGTQFMDSDTDHPADSPVERRAPVQTAQPAIRGSHPERTRDNGSSTNAPEPPAPTTRDWFAILAAVEKHLPEPKPEGRQAHFKNWYGALEKAGVVTKAMTDAEVIAALEADRAAQSKAGRGWYRDTDALAALNVQLAERFGADAATLCKTLKVKLSDFADAGGFLAHVEANSLDITQSVAF